MSREPVGALARRTDVRWLLVPALCLALTGCGDDVVADHGGDVPGKAREAVDCPGNPWQQGSGNYDTGPEAVQEDARAAVEDYLREEGFLLPDVTVDETARHDQAVLFTWREGSSRLAAFVVHEGMEGMDGDRGWGVYSYAYCDPAFWPPARSDEAGYQVWSNADGDRVPTSLVYSMAGSDDCGGPDMTFLYVGRDVFYGNPGDGFSPYATVPYTEHAPVPTDARDTGYQRDGRELWLTGAAAYLALPDGDAERWPAPTQQLGCG